MGVAFSVITRSPLDHQGVPVLGAAVANRRPKASAKRQKHEVQTIAAVAEVVSVGGSKHAVPWETTCQAGWIMARSIRGLIVWLGSWTGEFSQETADPMSIQQLGLPMEQHSIDFNQVQSSMRWHDFSIAQQLGTKQLILWNQLLNQPSRYTAGLSPS